MLLGFFLKTIFFWLQEKKCTNEKNKKKRGERESGSRFGRTRGLRLRRGLGEVDMSGRRKKRPVCWEAVYVAGCARRGCYGASGAQGLMLVTVMLSPRHLRTPASHSVIVCSLPFTSTQTRNPASSHSEAALQTHLLLWASHFSQSGHAPQAFSAEPGRVQVSPTERV